MRARLRTAVVCAAALVHWARHKHSGLSRDEAVRKALQELEASAGEALESVIVVNPRKRPALYASLDDIHPDERIPDHPANSIAAQPIRTGQEVRRVDGDDAAPAGSEEPSFGFAMTDAAKSERVRVYVATREELERQAAPPS